MEKLNKTRSSLSKTPNPMEGEKMKRTLFQPSQLTMLLLAFAVLVACGGGGDGGGDDGTTSSASWTYMVYMGADNNLSSAGLVDLNEMESVGSNANVKIVLQAEFSDQYTPNLDSSHGYDWGTLRFLVTNDNDTSDVNLAAGTSIGNQDMGDPATLSAFITWATTNYPADHYALVIWDHGAGWKKSRRATMQFKGAVQDATSGSFMSLPDLAQAVTDAGVHLDIINFDACLMGMYEVLYEFNGLVDYMVFSEETEPGNGDPYDTILAALVATPSMSARTLSQTIVNAYYNYYSDPAVRTEGITKSAVDMSLVGQLHTQVLALADGIVTEYNSISSTVTAAQQQAQAYEYAENHDLYDFADYLATYLTSDYDTKTAAADIMDTVTSMVVANKTYGSEVADSHGIAIYAPTNNQISSASDDLTSYGQLACNASRASVWLDAVNVMVDNSGDTDTVLEPGGFAFYVYWQDTNTDVDLYVIEPSGTAYAPWMGQSTPNGYFSADSIDSGENEEYYAADDYVEAGDYDVMINLYDSSNSSDVVSLYYIDPENGYETWQLVGQEEMDLNNQYPGTGYSSLDDLASYSDWWYPGNVTRELTDGQTIRLLSGERTFNITIKHKKAKPIVADEKR